MPSNRIDRGLWTLSMCCLGAAAPLLSLGRITMLAVFALGVLTGLAAVLRTRRGGLGTLVRDNRLPVGAALAFLAIALLSSLLSEWPDRAALKTGDLALQCAMLFGALAVVGLAPREARRLLVLVFLGTFAASVLYTLGDSSNCVANAEIKELYRWCTKRGRHRGTAFAVLLPLAIGFYLSNIRDGRERRIGLGGAAVICMLALAVFLSSSRTASLVAFGGVGLFVILSALQGRFRAVWLAAPAVAAAFVISATVLELYAPNIVDARLQLSNPELGAFNGREAAWRAAIDLWSGHPWLGVGVWNYRYLIDDFGHAHNFILEIMSDTGLLGLLAVTALLLTLALRLLRGLSNGPASIGFAASVAAFFAASMAATSIFYGWWLCILFAVLAAGSAASRVEAGDRGDPAGR